MNAVANQPVSTLQPDDFVAFYEAIHDQRRPFQWQIDMANEVVKSGWRSWIDLPTASGKTAVIDIAVFALALQASRGQSGEAERAAPRRIFFTVDRRLVVNQSFNHAMKLATALWDAARLNRDPSPQILVNVARALKSINGGDPDSPPLDCFELRGGIYRDDAWVRSITQPTLIATTVDQIGSRMLFRGYGVSDRNLPIHAALTTNDALIILDEAHCSVPFGETVDCVTHYRGEHWAEKPIKTPFEFVRMTATPPGSSGTSDENGKSPFQLTSEHYTADEPLRKRHYCSKRIGLLLEEKAKGKNAHVALAKTIVGQATQYAEQNDCTRIGIVVNRIATARAVYSMMQKAGLDVQLLIGRMRPIDRDDWTPELEKDFSSDRKRDSEASQVPKFLVATQTIEVGADYDFDAMVCQCASLDALKQRFGRLNRLGKYSHCHGVIVAGANDILPEEKLDDEKPLDPIYYNAIARTWHALNRLAGENQEVEFGIRVEGSVNEMAGEAMLKCIAPVLHSPVLMPAHVDMLCQTFPKPAPEIEIASYLHGAPPPGKKTTQPSVRVCWRADFEIPRELVDLNAAFLSSRTRQSWIEATEVCPPSTGECMVVPRWLMEAWLKGNAPTDLSSDVDGGWEEESDERTKPAPDDAKLARYGLVWRGAARSVTNSNQTPLASFVVGPSNSRSLFDGDTIMLPVEFGGWSELGHVPELRISTNLPSDPAAHWQGIAQLIQSQTQDASEPTLTRTGLLPSIDIAESAFERRRGRSIVRLHEKISRNGVFGKLSQLVLKELDSNASIDAKRLRDLLLELNQSDEESSHGSTEAMGEQVRVFLDWGGDGYAKSYPGGLVWITQKHVSKTGLPPLPSESFDDEMDSRQSVCPRLNLLDHLSDVTFALDRHSALIPMESVLHASLLDAAKWHDVGKIEPRFQANLLGRPLSLARLYPHLLAKSGEFGRSRHSTLPIGFRHESFSVQCLEYADLNEESCRESVQYLIQTHHGQGRPAMATWVDESPEPANLAGLDGPSIEIESKQTVDIDLFWDMIRRYGPWGCAYLESIVRLSDWQASANPGSSGNSMKLNWRAPVDSHSRRREPLLVTGLDASNPLAYLAAIGLFRIVAEVDSRAQFSWSNQGGTWHPQLHFDSLVIQREEEFVDCLVDHLESDADGHLALSLFDVNQSLRDRFLRVAMNSTCHDRLAADWLSCESSDIAPLDAISQLQTSRRDYHAGGIRGLIEISAASHLRRTLFQNWDYADPIAGLSLHLEPREDRRHAYQWHTPSGDPTRKVHGGMIGANRLALEAWPMFQSIPKGEKLATVGFIGQRVTNTRFRWPVWSTPMRIRSVSSLLTSSEIQAEQPDYFQLQSMSIKRIFQCMRILVGKTPNLTLAAAVP